MGDYWIDNNIKKPQPFVVCAAVRYDKLIIPSARHYDKVMNEVIKAIGNLDRTIAEQGFINQFGEFLTRKEAMIIAKDFGQTISLRGCGNSKSILYSEGLY
jgi:hypothetical protein